MASYTPAEHTGHPEPTDDERAQAERKRDIIVLISRFLYEYGYIGSYQMLCTETGLSLQQVDVADNIDLWSLVQEYIDYYHSKFGRYPRLTRPVYPEYQMAAVAMGAAVHPGSALDTPVAPGELPHYGTVSTAITPAASGRSLQAAVRAGSMLETPGISVARTPSEQAPLYAAVTIVKSTGLQATQDDFVNMLSAVPNSCPAEDMFEFSRPRRQPTKRKSSLLDLSDLQESVLYALVGCTGVGWVIKNIKQNTKTLLQDRYIIDKDMLQIFFKNRAQRFPKRQRTDGNSEGEAGDGMDMSQPGAATGVHRTASASHTSAEHLLPTGTEEVQDTNPEAAQAMAVAAAAAAAAAQEQVATLGHDAAVAAAAAMQAQVEMQQVQEAVAAAGAQSMGLPDGLQAVSMADMAGMQVQDMDMTGHYQAALPQPPELNPHHAALEALQHAPPTLAPYSSEVPNGTAS